MFLALVLSFFWGSTEFRSITATALRSLANFIEPTVDSSMINSKESIEIPTTLFEDISN